MRANNMAAMREALDRIGNTAVFVAENYGDKETAKYMTDIIMDVQSAISAPPRNCDVGTAEEQADRLGKLCIKYYNEEEHCNRKCPLASLDFIHGFPRCQAHWAQMPYESEAKDAE